MSEEFGLLTLTIAQRIMGQFQFILTGLTNIIVNNIASEVLKLKLQRSEIGYYNYNMSKLAQLFSF